MNIYQKVKQHIQENWPAYFIAAYIITPTAAELATTSVVNGARVWTFDNGKFTAFYRTPRQSIMEGTVLTYDPKDGSIHRFHDQTFVMGRIVGSVKTPEQVTTADSALVQKVLAKL